MLAELPEEVETDQGEADGEGEPEPATWRKVVLRASKADGSFARVELLRSLAWIERHQAHPGGVVEISVPECGIEGRAEVLAIAPCPPVHAGPGRVVTGTFAHQSAKIVDVYVEGLDEPIGATANHPFWSEDRQDFVRADSLRPGERLRALLPIDEEEDANTVDDKSPDEEWPLSDKRSEPPAAASDVARQADDTTIALGESTDTFDDAEDLAIEADACYLMQVVRVVPRGEPEPVYNLEVQFVHVYNVTAAGVLVHNARPCNVLETPWGARDARTGKWTSGPRGGKDPVDDFMARARESGYKVHGKEMTVRTPFGNRRYDVVIERNGRVTGVEIKSSKSEFTKLNSKQIAKDRYVRRYGSQVIGGKAPSDGLTITDTIKIQW